MCGMLPREIEVEDAVADRIESIWGVVELEGFPDCLVGLVGV
jgi:hypothetical protein